MSADEQSELAVSRNQLDRAGTRVRACRRDGVSVPDRVLTTIDEFRAWHLPTVRLLQGRLSEFFHELAEISEEDLPITSRLKTSNAIVAKLARSQTSLPRIQDIAGARIVVSALGVQDVVADAVGRLLADELQHVKDQREEPDQYGYRAMHLIVRLQGRLCEVQVRTAWQDRWAQIVERIDGALSTDLKHGNGPADWLEWLHSLSDELRKADLGQSFDIPAMPFDLATQAEGEE